MPKKYFISKKPGLLRDEASVRRHVSDDDYFGTLATILGLLKEEIEGRSDKRTALLLKTIGEMETDLVFLQANYRIKERAARASLKSGRKRLPRKAG